MFGRTTPKLFYKNFSERHVMHPGRRWLYHKVFGVGVVGACVYFPTSFYLADTMEENGKTFGPYFVVQAIELLPLNILSRFAGAVASSEYLPPSAHHKLIEYYCSFYSVDLTEAAVPGSSGEVQATIADYPTLQSFFTRELVKGARPVSDEGPVVSPCDAALLRCGEVGADNLLVQVKGCSYSISNLLRTQLPIPANSISLMSLQEAGALSPAELSKKTKRLFFSFHLGPADYHRFHSPLDFEVRESILMPGLLFPVMRSATKWFPMLYVNNERVAVHGPIKSKKGESEGSNQRQIGLALVGALNVGSIALLFDERVRSNLADPPSYAVHRQYSEKAAPILTRGQQMGMFKMGSSIVMVLDVPADQQIQVKTGDKVKVGQCLVK